MLHTITKLLEICIYINTEITYVDRYMWIFTSRIFRLALEITFLLKKWFTSYSHKAENLISRVPNKRGFMYELIYLFLN